MHNFLSFWLQICQCSVQSIDQFFFTTSTNIGERIKRIKAHRSRHSISIKVFEFLHFEGQRCVKRKEERKEERKHFGCRSCHKRLNANKAFQTHSLFQKEKFPLASLSGRFAVEQQLEKSLLLDARNFQIHILASTIQQRYNNNNNNRKLFYHQTSRRIISRSRRRH